MWNRLKPERISYLITCLLLAGCVAHSARAATKTGHAPVNGISIYYEVHGAGAGTPLVLLAGGGSTIESNYGRVIPLFAKQRTVIALDEQNHGRSGHRSVPERFTDSADDVAALLAHLGVARADILGFSNGASVALQVAIRHPERVRKLVFASSLTKRSGVPSQFWTMFDEPKFENMPQPLKDAFLEVNPDQALLRDMFAKDAERMKNFVETSDDEVRRVNVPTLVIAADRDVPTLEHTLELSRLFPNGRLLILPAGHGDYLGERMSTTAPSKLPELAVGVIEEFLDRG